MIVMLGIFVPALLGMLGLGMAFMLKGTGQLIGLFLMFAGGAMGTFQMAMLRFMTPSALKIFEAKLNKKTLLFMWMENGQIVSLAGKFESGWIWLRERLGYLISSSEDRGYLDGIPTFIAFRGVGKTLTPKIFADITLMEKYGIDFDYLRMCIEKKGQLPEFEFTDEMELVEKYTETEDAKEVEVNV